MSEIKNIWSDDLLDRRWEADLIETYLVGRSKSFMEMEREEGLTFSLDAPYGTGKSFFLQRLYRQVKQRHPAAFIDAWADDTIDSPWAAIFSAIDDALEPHRSVINSKLATKVGAKSRRVMESLVKSAVKKGASFVIGDDGWDDVIDAMSEEQAVTPVKDYRERKKAVQELREAISELVASLSSDDARAPIFIFVDELDRCRPTYAVSFLEEIKHLFNVPGVVFVFAMNKAQLGAAIKAVYGTEFDSSNYLRRFVSKFYSLSMPDVYLLTKYHIDKAGIDRNKFAAPPPPSGHTPVDFFVARSMSYWGVEPRDVLRVVDALTTASTVWQYSCPIRLELYLPLVIQEVLGINQQMLDGLAAPSKDYNFKLEPTGTDDGIRGIKRLRDDFKSKSKIDFYHFHNQNNSRSSSDRYIQKMMAEEFEARKPLDPHTPTILSDYPELVKSLAVILADTDPE